MKTGEVITLDGRPFKVVESLGSGRTAEAALVRHGETEWVLKALRDPERAAIDPARFLAEAEILRRLRAVEVERGLEGPSRFPAVYFTDADRCLLAMERAAGRSLAELVGQTALSVEQCLSVGRQLCEALGVAIEAGVYNPDLKLDSIFWDPDTDHLTVIDWNVCRPWPPDRADLWLDPYVAIVAEVLDHLLLDLYGDPHAARPDWSRPFRRSPDRWADSLRVFQLTFEALSTAPSDWTVAALAERLRRIESALLGEPEVLLRAVVDLLVAARESGDGHAARLEEALAFGELAANVHHPAIIFRARELIGQAVDLLGPDAEAIETLRRAIRGEGREIHVPPGDAIELHRLKRLAHAGRAVLGASDGIRQVMDAFERLRWQRARSLLEGLMQRFASQETLTEELEPLAHEAAGLSRCADGLRHLHDAQCFEVPDGTMHGFDPASVLRMEGDRVQALERSAQALDEGVEQLRRVPWWPALAVRFPEIETVAGQVRAEVALARERLAATEASERARLGRAEPAQPTGRRSASQMGGAPDPIGAAIPPMGPGVIGDASAGTLDDGPRSTPGEAGVPGVEPEAGHPPHGVDEGPHRPSSEDAPADPLDEAPPDPGGAGGSWVTLGLLLLAIGLAIAVFVIWPFGPPERPGRPDARVDAIPERLSLSVGEVAAAPDAEPDAAAALDAAVEVDIGRVADAATIVDAEPIRDAARPQPRRRQRARRPPPPPPPPPLVVPRRPDPEDRPPDRGPPPPPPDARPPAPQDAAVPPPDRGRRPTPGHDYSF